MANMVLRASELKAVSLCPGKKKAEEGLPEIQSEDATSGTRVHEALGGFFQHHPHPSDRETIAELALEYAGITDEMEVAKMWWCISEVERIMTAYMGDDSEPSEMRILCADNKKLTLGGTHKILTGHPDLIVAGSHSDIHVFDYKTGWGKEGEASAHDQIQSYMLMAYLHYCVGDLDEWNTFYGHIVSWGEGTTTVTMNETDMQVLHAEIAKLWRNVNSDNPEKTKRVPGTIQCQFCKACGTDRCPESTKYSLPTVVDRSLPMNVVNIQTVLEVAPVATRVIQAAKEAAKAMLKEDPESLPGWKLQKTGSLRSVEDPLAAYNLLADVLTADDYLKACDVKITKLRELYHDRLNHIEKTTKKAAGEKLEAIIEPCVVRKEKDPAVVRDQ